MEQFWKVKILEFVNFFRFLFFKCNITMAEKFKWLKMFPHKDISSEEERKMSEKTWKLILCKEISYFEKKKKKMIVLLHYALRYTQTFSIKIMIFESSEFACDCKFSLITAFDLYIKL